MMVSNYGPFNVLGEEPNINMPFCYLFLCLCGWHAVFIRNILILLITSALKQAEILSCLKNDRVIKPFYKQVNVKYYIRFYTRSFAA